MSIKKLLFVLYGVPFLFLFFFLVLLLLFLSVRCSGCSYRCPSLFFFFFSSFDYSRTRAGTSFTTQPTLSLAHISTCGSQEEKKKRYRTCRCCCFCCFLTRCAALLDSPFFSSSCLFASQTACFPCVRVTIRKRHTTACVAANAHTANL